MAQIKENNDNSILKISAFLGLNENPDGDTTLRVGELAMLRNFRITRDGHLQIRPGTRTLLRLGDALNALLGDAAPAAPHLRGVWRGNVGGSERLLAAFGGRLWEIVPATLEVFDRGSATDADTVFFGFGGKVYLLNGADYKVWDGSSSGGFTAVDGYVPLIQTATTPGGQGTQLEQLNRLTGKRRVQFSPDGAAAVFVLPEQGIDSVDRVTLLGEVQTAFTADSANGTVTLASVPEAGTNTLEIAYTKGSGSRSEVTAMRFCELYNGTTDTRVFLYGDGSNRTVYSGVCDTTGQPSAEYFPALSELSVGESNTPLTALVRHYDRLMAFKPNSAWMIRYGSLTLATGELTAGFSCQPVNRQIGNEAPGQVKLLENNPLTIDAGGIFQWKSNGYINSSESNAQRISDRVGRSLADLGTATLKTFDRKREHEFWLLCSGTALILNYANNTWYVYKDLPFSTLIEADGETYGFADDGRLLRFSREHRNDDGEALRCYAATGAMDFGKDWLVKYSPMIYVAMQPEVGARVNVTVESNRRSDYPSRLVAHGVADFVHVDFRHFSFNTNRKPQIRRVKLKVRKATYYRLIFKSTSASATATVLETDVRLRSTGTI